MSDAQQEASGNTSSGEVSASVQQCSQESVGNGGNNGTDVKVFSDDVKVHSGETPVPPGKSSISVIFTEFVPGGKNTDESLQEEDSSLHASYNRPVTGGRPRYFQMHRGHRPGLGLELDLNSLVPKGKFKTRKRKTPQTIEYLHNESLVKRIKLTPERPATQIVHEIEPNLQCIYEDVENEGSKGTPSFTCTIKFPALNGADFVGTGRSKKLAKTDAAEKILASLGVEIPPKEAPKDAPAVTNKTSSPDKPNAPARSPPETKYAPPIFPSYPVGRVAPPTANMEIDFASDDVINMNFASPETSSYLPALSLLSQPMVNDNMFRRLRNIPNFEENVLLALNTLYPGAVEYANVSEEGPPHDKKFTIKVSFNGQEYTGQGCSKKKAKADAAKNALISVLGNDCYSQLVMSSPTKPMPLSNSTENIGNAMPTSKKKKKSKSDNSGPTNTPVSLSAVTNEEDVMDEDDGDDDFGEYDLNFSDHVCNTVREKYEELMGKDSTYSSFKVLAGVVMTVASPMIYNSTVIAVTTGTKCIEGDCMSEKGLSVNDCHAEILATRCVRDYLYSQIEMFENAKTDSERIECILERNAMPGTNHKYALKPGIKFHLYISTAPCGDARIFSPKGIELDEDAPEDPASLEIEDTHPNKLNRGVLRSKIEAGEGTIPSANLYSGPQTWDSIVSGNALYTMSCSDKVCRWNVLGLQGALLYNFLGLIHYSSITLGSLHHPVHFRRAVYGRVQSLNSRLDMPFYVNKPKLMMVSREEKRRVKKSPNHAVCWTLNWSTPEILAASKGRCEPGGVASRLTKRMSFTRFLKLYKNETGRRENFVDLTYHEAKLVASDYQKAKEEFIEYFKDSKLGPWIGKPIEQDSFKVK